MTALFPLVPNWSEPLKETLEYSTEVLVSRDGTEQRRAVRQTPRTSIAFNAIADGDRLRDFERLMGSELGSEIRMPDFTSATRITAGVAAGAFAVDVESVPTWLVENAWLAVQDKGKNSRNLELVQVESVVGTTATLVSTLGRSYLAGARLRPTLAGRLRGGRANLLTMKVATSVVNFDVTPGIYVPQVDDFDATGVEGFLGGREVLLSRPNWSSEPQIAYDKQIDTVDYGFGRAAYFNPRTFATRTTQATYLKVKADQLAALKAFFKRRMGARGDFYVPSYVDDFDILEAFVGGASTIKVAGREVYDAYHLDTAHRAITVRTFDGMDFTFEVSAIALSSGNSVLTITNPLPWELPAASVRFASWLLLCRFVGDSATFEWITDGVGQTTFTIMTLPWVEGENDPLATLDEAAYWLLSTFGWKFTFSVFIVPLDYTVNGQASEVTSGVNPLGAQLERLLEMYQHVAGV